LIPERVVIDFGGEHEAVTKRWWEFGPAKLAEHQAADVPQTPLSF
jgi:hypothetical protein